MNMNVLFRGRFIPMVDISPMMMVSGWRIITKKLYMPLLAQNSTLLSRFAL